MWQLISFSIKLTYSDKLGWDGLTILSILSHSQKMIMT